MTSLLAIHWNVDPEMFHIGSFGLRYYSVGFLLAFVTAYLVLERMFKKEKVRVEYLDKLTIYVFFATLIGARLGHCLFYEPDYYLTAAHWTEIVWPFSHGRFTGYQGLASHGAAIGILLTLYLFWHRYRMNIWWLLDRLVIVVALAGCFIRLGNLFNSEIYGHATTLPWGFIFEREGETEPKHPTQLYESLSYLAIFGGCLWYYLRKKGQVRSGTIFGWWLVTLWGARLLIEFLKNDQVDFEANMLLNMGQLLSLPFILAGVVLIIISRRGTLPQGPFPKGEKITFDDSKNKKK